MSMHFIPSPSSLPAAEPCGLARCFGDHVLMTRIMMGRSVEEVAGAAGLTDQEWRDIEAGTLPDSWEQVALMAAALGVVKRWLDYVTRLYVLARKQQLFEAGIVLRSGQKYS